MSAVTRSKALHILSKFADIVAVLYFSFDFRTRVCKDDSCDDTDAIVMAGCSAPARVYSRSLYQGMAKKRQECMSPVSRKTELLVLRPKNRCGSLELALYYE